MELVTGKLNKLINDLAQFLEAANQDCAIITILFKQETDSILKDQTYAFGTATNDDGVSGMVILKVGLDGSYDPVQIVFEWSELGKFGITTLDPTLVLSVDDTVILLTTLDAYINDVDNPALKIVKNTKTDPDVKRVLH